MLKRMNNDFIREVISIIMITAGVIIAAFSLETFLIPNTILDGGVTGISIIISKLVNIPLSLLVVILNIPFIYIGYKNIGKRFLLRTIYCIALFSLFLEFFKYFEAMTDEVLLATIFGGGLLGIGVGLIIRFGGCVDGTESLAIVISKKTNLSVGQIIMIFNIVIYSIAGLIFGLDRALYSLLTYIITFNVIDFVSEGLEQAKAAMIITDKGSSLSKEIYSRLGRTTTSIRGKGLLSGEKDVLYCVLTRIEVYELRNIVSQMDKSAFITILEVSDIIGTHIKSTDKLKD